MLKKFTVSVSLLFFIALFLPVEGAIYTPIKEVRQERLSSSKNKELSTRQAKKLDRKKAKLEKKRKRIYKKLKKKGIRSEEDVWDNGTFRLGIIFLAGAIILGLVVAVLSLGSLFSLIASLFAIAGVVMIIYSLVQYYG